MPDDLTRYQAHRERLDSLEAKYTRKLRTALVRSCEPALTMVEAGADAALAAAMVDTKQVVAVLTQLYVEAGQMEAQITYDYLTEGFKALAPPAIISRWGQRLKNFITTEGGAAVKGITDTTRKLVRNVLNEAAAAGDGIEEAARKLRAEVASFSKRRAVTIARSELVAAGNYGSLLGAESTDLRLNKVWLATPGPRTRPEHQAANGQAAPLQDGFFVVGGERARYPGDPLLSAGMRINCRCAIIYKQASSQN